MLRTILLAASFVLAACSEIDGLSINFSMDLDACGYCLTHPVHKVGPPPPMELTQ